MRVFIKESRFDKTKKQVFFNAAGFEKVPKNATWDDPSFFWSEFENFSRYWQEGGVEEMEAYLRGETLGGILIWNDDQPLYHYKKIVDKKIKQAKKDPKQKDFYKKMQVGYGFEFLGKTLLAKTSKKRKEYKKKLFEFAEEQQKLRKKIWDEDFIPFYQVPWR